LWFATTGSSACEVVEMDEMNGSSDRRVAITGMGIVTTIGQNPDEYLNSLIEGRSGITHWKQMDERIYSKIGGDMSGFDMDAHLACYGSTYPAELVLRARKLMRATPLSGRMAAAAAMQAFVDAGLAETSAIDPDRFGHVCGGHNLNAGYIYTNTQVHMEEPEFIDPLYGVMFLDTDVLAVVSELLNLKGPAFIIGGACATSNLGLLAGLDLLRAGRADAVVVSGCCFDFDAVTLQGWALIDALSYQSFNDEPGRASRPFDARREGFVPSHGAGAVVLESLASARRRDAHVYAELRGAASASDASRLTKPVLQGQVRAIRLALADAGIKPDQVDYVNAHATSTPLGDAMEVAAIKAVLGDRAYQIPINSTKSMAGHCLGAAAIVELVATLLQMEHEFVHPTINQEVPDPELDLDFVPNEARQYRFGVAISNSFGFGGLNSCVVVSRV
jgi:3-oxoacyl-(acyl-carrier-protein) synthase